MMKRTFCVKTAKPGLIEDLLSEYLCNEDISIIKARLLDTALASSDLASNDLVSSDQGPPKNLRPSESRT